MLDTVEVTKLENLWKRRKRKRLALFGSLFIFSFLVIFIVYLVFLTDSSDVTVANGVNNGLNSNSVAVGDSVQVKKQYETINQNGDEKLAFEGKKYISSPQNANEDQKFDDNLEDAKLKEKLQKVKDVKTLKEKAKSKEQNDVIVEEKANKKDKYISETDMSAYFSNKEGDNIIEEPLYRIESSEPTDSQAVTKPKKKIEITATGEKSSTPNPANVKISSTNAKSDILLLENNFKSTGDSKYALELARVYYEKKDFKNAAKWAFELNNLDKNDPNGWIIFSKAKYNNGEKSDAIKVLEAYKGRATNPDEIQALILQMQSNENIK